MVRNGDAYLKNFGQIYRSTEQVWLAPMFDVVSTSIFTYTQYSGCPELEVRTLALKLFAGKLHSKAYPTTAELEDFGRHVCGVSQPARTSERIAQAMHRTLKKTKSDLRLPKALQALMAQAWTSGYGYAK